MEISVFKKVTIPKSKEDKKRLSFFASKPYLPDTVSCSSTEELIDIITKNGWSPSVFKKYRSQKGFKQTSFLVLDIDNGLTIDEALERTQKNDLFCVCLPTSSHTDKLNKFRLIFVTDKTIIDSNSFEINMLKLRDIFPEADPSCVTDQARFYFPCKFSDEGFIYNGELFEVQHYFKETIKSKKTFNDSLIPTTGDISEIVNEIYGKNKKTIPSCVDFFIKNAKEGLEGRWIVSLNSFVFTLSLQGLSLEHVYDIVSKLAPYELDSRDEDCIERAYIDGESNRSVSNE